MRVILITAAVSVLAAPAFAASGWSAVPVTPSKLTGIVGDSVIWDCGASGCVAVSDTSSADVLSECRGLARQVGELTSFQAGRGPLDAKALATCNQAAPKH